MVDSNLSPSLIRTLVPLITGRILARIMPGIDPNDPNVLLAASAGFAWLYYTVIRVVETKWPKLGWLLGIAKAPAYSPAPAPSPAADENVVAVVVPDP